MIKTRKYTENDYDRIIDFLRGEYFQDKNERCWLAQRWEDMEYRINALYTIERKSGQSWHNYIMLWEEECKIVAICNNEGSNECFMQIKKGYEFLFPEMLDWAEENISRNVTDNEEKRKLTVFALESCDYKQKELEKRGYKRCEEFSYFKRFRCDKFQKYILPEGFNLISGTEGLNHIEISRACELGFHPDLEGKDYDKSKLAPSWSSRERAPMFDYKFEFITKAPNGEIASYTYVWVDKKTSSGYIEPVSTREKYRGLGLGKAMQIAVLNKLYEEKIDMCFVNPFGEGRDKFYSSAGYETTDKEYIWEKEF